MARYFIDLQDGNDFIRDDEGSSLDTLEIARHEAAHLVALRAYDTRPSSSDREFVATVRDEGGAAIQRATLTIRLEHLDRGAPFPLSLDMPAPRPAGAEAEAPAPAARIGRNTADVQHPEA